MNDRKPSPFPVLLNNDVCSLIQAAENVYQIRFKNRAANAYLVRGQIAHHHDRCRAVVEFSGICWNASIMSAVRPTRSTW